MESITRIMESTWIHYYRRGVSNWDEYIIERAWDLIWWTPRNQKTILLRWQGREVFGIVHHNLIVGAIQKWNGRKLSPEPSRFYHGFRYRGYKIGSIFDGIPSK